VSELRPVPGSVGLRRFVQLPGIDRRAAYRMITTKGTSFQEYAKITACIAEIGVLSQARYPSRTLRETSTPFSAP